MERLVEIMARLRAEGGCPWDREQDLRSLRPYLVEETYEVLDEMDRVAYGGPWGPLCEELGDLLFQIIFHAQLATELGEFTMADVCAAISDKITRRHPHVFGDARVAGAEQVLANWAKLKADERKTKTGREGSVLDGVPTAAPALLRAERLTEKASRIGFDWPDLAGVRGKLDEELGELDEAIQQKDRDAIEHELGDVLFSLANVARFIQTPAEDALRQAIRRFTSRFHEIEAGLREQSVPFGEATLEQMEALWQRAKAKEVAIPPPVHVPRAAVQAIRLPLHRAQEMTSFWDRVGPLLGWTRRQHTGGRLAWDAGSMLLSFVPARHDEAPEARSAMELLLDAPSRAAVETLYQELIGVPGAAVESPSADLEGKWGFTFRDPDGNAWRYGLS
ncbi:MAG: nucleoside triphosphate pyrophosphohydrolase [Myxococcaceae bacterium]